MKWNKKKKSYELGTEVRYRLEKLFVGAKYVYKGKWWYNLVHNLEDIEAVAIVDEDEMESIVVRHKEYKIEVSSVRTKTFKVVARDYEEARVLAIDIAEGHDFGNDYEQSSFMTPDENGNMEWDN